MSVEIAGSAKMLHRRHENDTIFRNVSFFRDDENMTNLGM